MSSDERVRKDLKRSDCEMYEDNALVFA